MAMHDASRAALLVTAGVLALSGATPALAQDRESARNSALGEAADAEEIVVLGARLEESTPEELADYGSRLEVIQGEAIDRAGYVDLSGALRSMVPGLFVS